MVIPIQPCNRSTQMALVSILETVRLESLQKGPVYLVLIYTVFAVGKVTQLLLESCCQRY